MSQNVGDKRRKTDVLAENQTGKMKVVKRTHEGWLSVKEHLALGEQEEKANFHHL